ncbi:hypothetical protein PENSPDRAFT_683320 [Peniophora sp. CONT]|nr:hypothetical protein PENSPDRAFT_683320 [Peniophora sp. CONT]
MVKSKSAAWKPLKGAFYKAVIRIHYFGNKKQILADLANRPPFTQRSTEDYDYELHLREDCRYLNFPDFNLFEVRLNKHHNDCVELWLKDARHGGDDLQRELGALQIDIRACRHDYFKAKEISEIVLFFVRSNFADIAPNWRPAWHVEGAYALGSNVPGDRPNVFTSPDIREPTPSVYTRSSSPSHLSDVSGETLTPALFRPTPSTPITSPNRPRKPSVVSTPSTSKFMLDRVGIVDRNADHVVVSSPVDGVTLHTEGSHPESWAAVRPHLEDALKPLFDEVPQARPPATATPFVMCRAIKTAFNLQAERSHSQRREPETPQASSDPSASSARVRELEALLDTERRARMEAETQCKSAERDLEFLREAHAQAEEKLSDLRIEMKRPLVTPSLYQAFLGVHSMAREVFE